MRPGLHSLTEPPAGAWTPLVHSQPFTPVPLLGVQGLGLSWAE